MAEEWSPAQRDRAFEEFWSKYPRKVAKHPARQKWAKLVISRAVYEEILNAIERFKRTRQWQDIGFIPHASTFLNQRRWEDEIEASAQHSRMTWSCDHEPRCSNLETCAVVASRVCPHAPACAKRTECLERIVAQWR